MIVETIFANLLGSQDYFNRVWHFLDESYFESGTPKTLYKEIKKYVDKYQGVPTKNAIRVQLEASTLNDKQYTHAVDYVNELDVSKLDDLQWAVDQTETYCQNSAVDNALSRAIEIRENADKPIEQRDKKIPDVGAIIDIMKDAVSVTFDNSVGHDWMDDYEARWRLYKNKTNKVPFRLNILNRITKGGVENATLNVLLAGVNVGKSLGLCSLAADYLKSGKNVLYISMEMSEEVCAKRIDANLLDVTLDDIDDGHITYQEYKIKMERFRKDKSFGRLKIKQYATGGANANTFRALLNELKLKKGFKPDIIIIDYLGICGSCRIRQYSDNSYALVKAIAEELRALAFDADVPIWTAAQTTRGGWDSSDINMSDIAESAGLPATADFILAVIETPELAENGQQLIKQIKSRYGDKFFIDKFFIGVKKGNQRWVEMDIDKANVSNNEEAMKAMKNTQKASEPPSSTRSMIDDLVDDLKTDKKENAKTCKW